MKRKRIAIGVDNFKELIDHQYMYVDKTLLVRDLIDSGSKVVLITRPRRFGKTLNVSMLKYFYEIPKCREYENENKEVSYLFDKLKIFKYEECKKEQGKYPVIFLTLKGAKQITWEETYLNLVEIISNEYKRHRYILEQSILSNTEKEIYQKIMDMKANSIEYSSMIQNLSNYLERYFKQKVMVLIDEYDTPIQAGYINGYYNKIINFMKSMLGKGLKGNNSLKQGVLTGIIKVAKESIFSDFNNPDIYTVITEPISDKFGFTEEEVEELLKTFNLEKNMEEVRRWYNGYKFGLNTTVYNPWSIINYVSKPEMGLRPYWINTSSNEVIKEVMQLDKLEGKKVVEDLLEGRPVEKIIQENVVYETIKTNPESAWSFLLHAGYLKITDKKQEQERITYNLAIPNLEVKTIYQAMLRDYFKDDFKISNKITGIINALVKADYEKFEIMLEELYFVYVSYHDSAIKELTYDVEEEKHENFHHGFILGLLMFGIDYYEIKSNREYGLGRPDIVLIPKDKTKPAYVFEFKWASRKSKKTLEYLLEQAKKQIKEERYVEGIEKVHHVENIIEIPVGFKGKEILMKITSYC